jgi:hypothetical protein
LLGSGALGGAGAITGRHVFFTVGHVLAQGLLALDQALLGLGLLTLVGNAWGHHFIDPGVDFAQLRLQLLAVHTFGPPAVGGALDQLEQIEGDLARHVHDLEPRQVGKYRQAKQEQGNQ